MYSHIWQAWSSDPGEGRIGGSRNRLELNDTNNYVVVRFIL